MCPIYGGQGTRQIARSLHLSESDVEDAFLGGLLHELGKLVLACSYPAQYEAAILRARQKAIPVKEAELEIFGTSHIPVGAYLLWLWGLPNGVIEIVARYDRPISDPPQTPLMAVHVANALVSEESEQKIDMECLTRMGLIGHLPEWKQMGEGVKQRAVA